MNATAAAGKRAAKMDAMVRMVALIFVYDCIAVAFSLLLDLFLDMDMDSVL